MLAQRTPNKLGGDQYNFKGFRSPCPQMSPAATNLMAINEAFRNGSITPQKKAELKDQLLNSASKGFLTMNTFHRQIFGSKAAQHEEQNRLPSTQSSPAIFRQQFTNLPTTTQNSPYRSPVQAIRFNDQHDCTSPMQCEASQLVEPQISPSQLDSPGYVFLLPLYVYLMFIWMQHDSCKFGRRSDPPSSKRYQGGHDTHRT